LFLSPYQSAVYGSYKPNENPGEVEFYEMSRLLQRASKGNIDLGGQRLVFDGQHAHLQFYVMKLQSKGVDMAISELKDVSSGIQIIMSQKSDIEWIKASFELQEEYWDGKVLFATVGNRIQ